MTAATETFPPAGEGLARRSPVPRPRRVPRRSDRSLIRGAQDGSEADLEALFRRHWPRAYRAAFLIVHDHAAAEDIAQEGFLSAVRNLERFDRRRPFEPWLGTIVARKAIDWARARAARRESAPPVQETIAAAVEDPGPSSRGYSDEVLAALAGLSPEHRAVIVLRYVLEYTPQEIGRALHLPRGTVNSRLRRGLDALGEALGGKGS